MFKIIQKLSQGSFWLSQSFCWEPCLMLERGTSCFGTSCRFLIWSLQSLFHCFNVYNSSHFYHVTLKLNLPRPNWYRPLTHVRAGLGRPRWSEFVCVSVVIQHISLLSDGAVGWTNSLCFFARIELCHFSQQKIYPSRGKKYVRIDGKVRIMCRVCKL